MSPISAWKVVQIRITDRQSFDQLHRKFGEREIDGGVDVCQAVTFPSPGFGLMKKKKERESPTVSCKHGVKFR